MLPIIVAYEELRKVFVTYIDTDAWSDVVLQVRTLYARFAAGEFPYQPIPMQGWELQPIYMPLHWWPSGLAIPLHLDIRLIGFGFLALAGGVYGWLLAGQARHWGWRALALILPSLPLWGFIFRGPIDISVSYEIIVGAYYLILAAGLVTKRLEFVVLGIILCLLSRYTLIFWLPFFAILLFSAYGWKKSILAWSVVGASFLLLYVIPFYSRDPMMLNRGVTHYLNATVADWHGFGDPPVSYTQEYGISFAPHMKAIFPGDIAQRVSLARKVQVVLLLGTLLVCIWAYRRWRDKIDIFTFGLISLHVFLTVYYFFAPLTYRYYLFSYLIVSAVLCGKIISFHQRMTPESSATRADTSSRAL